MNRHVKLSRVESTFEEFDYPLSREAAAAACSDVTVRLADGDANLGDLIARIHDDRVTDAHDLYMELQNVLPIEAVGEPFQSDGDA
jgi:hypothetical protein